ncbi:GNAT family N-acetyltransferase [Clostridium botulinum]|uniref:N-acetyltransferase domain-containing protein n=1 Tax=Clostridium botulinum TaxID=1491 RepID=A0A9Q1UZX3_CLOBO|nr:GNAT family N-acetyltransferase [Clostridium botulinum]AEB75145.1 hypothetical protein CbC4_0465 [Clostridium botulinum BKT015925]KEI01889.1 hypothetical protein Z953_08430 [Clostridium botulinum D str. 16868]KEI05600.1 hypothetical protein Y848_05545 [Clostridium botulinum C/D str. Sp77]KLU75066.1 hypothetical protein CBC3_11430 [Clostridium botulinum V891]KOA77185.1 hypothetical protein ADU78_04260 [Clostridium botulinum]
MSELIYREVKKDDYERIKFLINEAWKFEKFTSNLNVKDKSLEIYLRTCLLEKNYTQVVEQNGEVIGLIFGKTNNGYNFLKNIKNIPSMIVSVIQLIFENKKDRKNMREYSKVQKAYKQLLKEYSGKFDGEVVLFVVGKECRGKGIGKRLMNNFLDFCKRKEQRKIYLFTDTQCNYGFYDNNGFKRIGEKDVSINNSDGEIEMGVFLYSYDI